MVKRIEVGGDLLDIHKSADQANWPAGKLLRESESKRLFNLFSASRDLTDGCLIIYKSHAVRWMAQTGPC